MANTITSQYFLTLFDEFQTVPNAKLEIFIGLATLRVAPSVWGAAAQYATALLTAHMIAAGGGAGGSGGAAGGALSSESVGDLSRSFSTVGSAGTGDQEYMTTRYGIAYVELRRETFATALATGPVTYLPTQSGAW